VQSLSPPLTQEDIVTATAGEIFLTSVLPIIKAAIGRGAVRPVGAEDVAELTADCVAIAARMFHAAEAAGKEVKPRSVAHFALQTAKAGRRFGNASRTDVMSAAAALDGVVHMCSLDEPVGAGDDTESEYTLHDLLGGHGEDVDRAAARVIDWGELESRLDDRKRMVLRDTAMGIGPAETANKLAVSAPYVVSLKRDCARLVRETWGEDALLDSVQPSAWRAELRASRGY